MSSLFNTMATAAINELTPDERQAIPEATLMKLIKICHDLAIADGADPLPRAELKPPPMQFMGVDLLGPGDFVWMPDCHFAAVEDVEPAGENMHIHFLDGGSVTARRVRNVKVALLAEDARAWNHGWGRLTNEQREHIVDIYGYRSVAV